MCIYINLQAEAVYIRSHAWPVFIRFWEEVVENQLKGEEGELLKYRVTQSSHLSPTSFRTKPQSLIKRSLNLLPEMFFFPETPCKRLGCKSNLMSASAVWISFLLKKYGHVPGWFHELYQSRTESSPRVASQQVWIQGTSHNEADPRDVFECLSLLALESLDVQPWHHLKNLKRILNTKLFCHVDPP